MRMQEALAARLSDNGTVMSTKAFLDSIARSPADSGGGAGTTTDTRRQRQVSLG